MAINWDKVMSSAAKKDEKTFGAPQEYTGKKTAPSSGGINWDAVNKKAAALDAKQNAAALPPVPESTVTSRAAGSRLARQEYMQKYEQTNLDNSVAAARKQQQEAASVMTKYFGKLAPDADYWSAMEKSKQASAALKKLEAERKAAQQKQKAAQGAGQSNSALPGWAKSFQKGDIGAGALGFVGATAGAAQSALLNASVNVGNLIEGKPLTWTPDMSYADFTKKAADVGNVKDWRQTLSEKSPIAGAAVTALGETFTDPLIVLPGGEMNDMVKNSANVLGTARYTKALQSGKMLGLPVTQNVAAKAADTAQDAISAVPVSTVAKQADAVTGAARAADGVTGSAGDVYKSALSAHEQDAKRLADELEVARAEYRNLRAEFLSTDVAVRRPELIGDADASLKRVKRSEQALERAQSQIAVAEKSIKSQADIQEIIDIVSDYDGRFIAEDALKEVEQIGELKDEVSAMRAAYDKAVRLQARVTRLSTQLSESNSLADSVRMQSQLDSANKNLSAAAQALTDAQNKVLRYADDAKAVNSAANVANIPVTGSAVRNIAEDVGTSGDTLAGKVPGAAKVVPTQPMPEVLPELSNSVVMRSPKSKTGVKSTLDNLYTAIVDKQHPIVQFSKTANSKTGMLASNSRNVGGTVDYILKDALVDHTGNKIGKSLKEVVGKIPQNKETDFWNYMSLRHNIDRAAEGKNVIANYTPEMSARAVSGIESANPAFKAAGDDVVNWIDAFEREWGVKSGIIDEDLYKSLRETYKSYFPTQREFSDLEKSVPDGMRRQYVNNQTPINTATGSERDINNPIENIMNLVNRTVRTARYNEVGQDMLKAVRANPDKLRVYAEIIPNQEGFSSVADNVVTVLEGGKPVYLRINDAVLLKALDNMPKSTKALPALSQATNIYKALITQYNPFFAVRNIARDVPTAYVYGSENNPVKFVSDLVKAGKEAATNGPNYQQYRALGGGGSNFFNVGQAEKAALSLTGKQSLGARALSGIEYFNNLTETMPRLAEFSRTLSKSGDAQKALDAANSVTVNFARGGNATKALDKNGVAYLNAGVQGIDKFFQGFSSPRKAVSTLAKAGISISTPSIALHLINKNNPNYQQLDNRTKDNYYLIPNNSDLDENGQAKTFIKVPKSRELGVLFGAFLERAMRVAEGEGAESAFKGYVNSLATSFAPTNPIENNILSPLTYNLATNKDFAGRAIVPQGMLSDNRSKHLQYDEKTSAISKAIAEYSAKAGVEVSPKQMDYLLDAYTGVIGDLALPGSSSSGGVAGVAKQQFTSDPIYSNQSITDFYDNLDKIQQISTDKNLTENIPASELTKDEKLKGVMNKASGKMSELSKIALHAMGKPLTKDEVKTLQSYSIDAKLTGDALQKAIRAKRIDISKEANQLYKNPDEMAVDLYRSDEIAKKVNAFTSAGIAPKKAYNLYKKLDALTPEAGKTSVSNEQRFKTILSDSSLDMSLKTKAISTYYPGSLLTKIKKSDALIGAYRSTGDTQYINMVVPETFVYKKKEIVLTDEEKKTYNDTFLTLYNGRFKYDSPATTTSLKILTAAIEDAKDAAKQAVIDSRR